MSKKHYQALARALHSMRPSDTDQTQAAIYSQWRCDMGAIMVVCGADNPRFDAQRFMQACHTGSCKGMRK